MPVTANDLGSVIAAFNWDRRRARTLFWVHFPLALVHLPLAFVFIGLPGFALFGWFALRSWRRWRNTRPVFELHENGITDRRNALPQRLRYDELTGYRIINRRWRFPFPFSFVRIHHIGLTARAGGKHFFVNEHLDGITHCVALLQQGMIRQRLPVLREQIANGMEARFGHLRVSGAGLHLAKKTLPRTSFGALRPGVWQVGRRQELALQLLDVEGKPWEILTRNELPDPALFILLLAELHEGIDVAVLLRDFCGLDMPASQAAA